MKEEKIITKEQRNQQYRYTEISNLVLHTERPKRRDNEPTGEVESLEGHLNPKQFGDRARAAPVEKKRKATDSIPKEKKKKPATSKFTNILDATEDFEQLDYKPKTKQTQETYELILVFLSKYLGDIPQEFLVSATDAVLTELKNENLKDFDRQKEIEKIIDAKIPSDQFAILINLGKKITDYGNDDNEPKEIDELDQEHGVPVIFDEEEEESDHFVNEEEDDDEGEDANTNTVLKTNLVTADSDESDKEDDYTTIISAPHDSGSAFKSKVMVPCVEIDAFWTQRTVSVHYPDPHTAQAKATRAMEILESDMNIRDAENELMELFDYEKFDLVKILTQNRDSIVWCTKLKRTSGAEREKVESEIRDRGLDWILTNLNAEAKKNDDSAKMDIDGNDERKDVTMKDAKPKATGQPKQTVDLQALAFEQGGHFMSNKKVKLPEGSFKRSKKGYEEVHIPPPKVKPMKSGEKLKPINTLPEWARAAFGNSTSLNRIQSQVYPTAFLSDENMLLCAPTGAGKTNCAMLTIMHEIGKHRNPETGDYNLDAFKIVYVAPMKALVAEMVGNFASRLKSYGVKVAELTGDRQLTKQQISETQIIVTTPEKWDIITRKATDRSYTKLVRLIIIDEIHLLHDSRGPVIESIVSRTIRAIEESQEQVRIIGLSATLPNYQDVATFMRVDIEKGLFFFDGSFRPCPLKQQYIGITEKKAIKRLALMNEIVYEKILEELAKNQDNQILVFCHSRKETAKTAKAIRDLAIQNETIGNILRSDAASREILTTEAALVKSEDLKDLLPYGFAIHHAGMTRADRTLVEELYADRNIPVLVSTATLAWGVNLPAHTVIIKGTQVYNPELGRWSELSPQDMLQMLGRAGRPQYDTFGEGVIITTHQELQYYLSLLNEQLPIESQLISKLPDIMNAEIVMGNIRNRQEAVDWLGYTYLYVRMLRNGSLYGVTYEDAEDDPYLVQKRIDFVHAAANTLDKCNLMKYDRKTGRFQGTELGRIASYYYISHNSMAIYNQHLKPSMTLIDLFRVFSLSEEFKLLPVRQEEKMELAKLLERVPIPVKESLDEPTAKINVLLQSYISQLKLEGFALMSDMVYVTQSAGRILRAIYEVCLRRGWAQLTRKALDLCKMVDKRSWLSMSPLRQFKGLSLDIIRRLEKKDIPWDRYSDLNPQALGELIKIPTAGKTIHKFIHQFPKLEVIPYVQPITRSMLKIELDISPAFVYDEKIHGGSETFLVLVEDVDSEIILYHDTFILKHKYSNEQHTLSFTVPLYEPLPPNYFISVLSDRWMHVETRVPVILKNLILPEKYPPHTELLDLQPLPVSALRNKEFQALYNTQEKFNAIQTQVFNSLYSTDDNALVCASVGSGKTICAEFALLRLWTNSPKARCVYVVPRQEVVDIKLGKWKAKFGSLLGGKEIVALTGDSAADLKLLELGDIIFATPEQWDALSRRWKQRKNVQSVGLFVMDDIHLIGGESGPVIEIIVSRMRYMSEQTGNKIRIVALGASLANARDIGEWIGAPQPAIFNFHVSVRPVPLDIHIQGYNIPHFASLMLAMAKPTYNAITTLAGQDPAIVFVPSRKQCRATALELLTFCTASGASDQFLHCSVEELQPFLDKLNDKALVHTVTSGIGFYHEGLSRNDKRIVTTLFSKGAIQVLVSGKDSAWGLELQAKLVVIMGSQFYEGREHRYVDYPVPDILQMMGRASRPLPGEIGKCVLMCSSIKKEFYKKFLHEALPVESHLNHFLHDHFNAEIVTKTIENKQDAVDYLTWTFLYRRMALNPNFYDLQGATHRHLSDHLSELVEQTLEDLSENKCILVTDDSVAPVNLGMIAAYYYINYRTIQAFSLSLKPKTRIQVLLDIITGAIEYEHIPIRHHEDDILRRVYDRLPRKAANPNFNDPHFKASILLQAHFSRFQLPPDLESDQKLVLSKVVRLIQACVDVISTNNWLLPALAAMELSQMCVQAIWDKDSPLKQIPHFSVPIIERLTARGVEHVSDLMEMEPEDRNADLQLDNGPMRDVVKFVNRFPSIELELSVEEDNVTQGESATLNITLERETDEDGPIGHVIAPFYPGQKEEAWWLVVGDTESKTLLGIKRITLQKKQSLSLEFAVPEHKVGKTDCKLYLMCDSYMGADQEFDFEINVLEGEQDDEDMQD
ncbi:Sec63 Brl domain-containing protein [Globomyces pollinis-pini]|nr:Sec63 Brl domain-containing protein [Globomyces pollinis-pini]